VDPSGAYYHNIQSQSPRDQIPDPYNDPTLDSNRDPNLLRNPEVVTLASDQSIQETPIRVSNGYDYRVSAETAQVFSLHAQRMKEEDARSDSLNRRSVNLTAPDVLKERRSSTDLRRKNVVK
jgi:hypothetical protein